MSLVSVLLVAEIFSPLVALRSKTDGCVSVRVPY